MPNDNVLRVSYFRLDQLKKPELLSRLNELHTKLVSLGQEDRPKGLNEISMHLLNKSILNHVDKDIRLLALCCLCDIFRIYAPDAPFSDAETITVFEKIVTQLRGLSTCLPESASGIKIHYLLHSLSYVKSCVIPVILSQAGVDGAAEVVSSMFEALLSSVHAEHPTNVLDEIATILEFCLEESTVIDVDIVEVLLTPLLPSSKTDNPTAFTVVERILRSLASHVEPSISKYINQILVGATIGESMDILDNIHFIIYELHKIAPELINRVIPNIATQLQSEEDLVRLNAVKLIGRLFASKNANYGIEFKAQFREFLVRFQDLSVQIRMEMLELGLLIMTRHAQLLSLVEDSMTRRLMDIDPKVRLSALQKLIELSMVDITKIKPETIVDLCCRVKDKKIDIASLALNGIAKIYSRFVSSILLPLDQCIVTDEVNIHPKKSNKISKSRDFSDHTLERQKQVRVVPFHSLVSRDVMDRCKCIPNFIINAFGNPDTPTRHLVVKLMQEHLLPRYAKHSTISQEGDVSSRNADTIADTDTSHNQKQKVKLDTKGTQNTQNDREHSVSSHEIDQVRAAALLLLYQLLSTDERAYLGTILGFKGKIRLGLTKFFNTIEGLHQSNRNGSQLDQKKSHRLTSLSSVVSSSMNSLTHQELSSLLNNSEEAELDSDDLFRSCQRLLELLPSVDSKKMPPIEKLAEFKDKHILRLFTKAISAHDSITDAIRRRDDLTQRLDSKSVLGQYCSYLYDIGGFQMANNSMIQALIAYLAQHIQHIVVSNSITFANDPTELDRANLLVLLAKHVPLGFKNCSPLLLSLLQLPSQLGAAVLNHPLITIFPRVCKHIAPVVSLDNEILPLCQAISEHIINVTDVDSCGAFAEVLLRIDLYIEEDRTRRSDMGESIAHSQQVRGDGKVEPDVKATSVILAHTLSSAENLNLENPNLARDLSTLANLFKIPLQISVETDLKHSFTSIVLPLIEENKEAIISFIKNSILSSSFMKTIKQLPPLKRAALEAHTKRSMSRTESNLEIETMYYKAFDTVCSGLQLYSSLVTTTAEIQEWIVRQFGTGLTIPISEKHENYQSLQDIMEVLFSALNSNGRIIGTIEIIDDSIEDYENVAINEARNLQDAHVDDFIAQVKKPDSSIFGHEQKSFLDQLCLKISETSVLCLIDMLKLQIIGKTIEVEYWKNLGWQFILSSDLFKNKLVNRFTEISQTYPLHPRFLAYYCLLANDDAVLRNVEIALQVALKRMRATYERLTIRCAQLQGPKPATEHIEGDNDEDNNLSENVKVLQQLARSNMPEVILPYVLYLLSYHPQFPVTATLDDKDDPKKTQTIIGCIRLIIKCLLLSSPQADNLSYLLKQVNTIVSEYVDRVDNGNIGIHFISRVAIQLLKENIKTSDNVQVFPGIIHVPTDLYQTRKELKLLAIENKHELVHIDTVENSQEIFEKIYQNKVLNLKGIHRKGKRLMSPTGANRAAVQRRQRVSPTAAAGKRTKRVKSFDSDDENDDDNDDDEAKSKLPESRNHKIKVDNGDEEVLAQQQHQAQRVSTRPVRATRASVNYAENEESENEVAMWERDAARRASIQSEKKKSPVRTAKSTPKAARKSNIGSNIRPSYDKEDHQFPHYLSQTSPRKTHMSHKNIGDNLNMPHGVSLLTKPNRKPSTISSNVNIWLDTNDGFADNDNDNDDSLSNRPGDNYHPLPQIQLILKPSNSSQQSNHPSELTTSPVNNENTSTTNNIVNKKKEVDRKYVKGEQHLKRKLKPAPLKKRGDNVIESEVVTSKAMKV